MQKAEVLGQLEGEARIASYHPRADDEGTETAAPVVEPVRHLGTPVADVLSRIQQQPPRGPVLREQGEVARQEQDERLGAVVCLRLRLVAVVALFGDPIGKGGEQAAKPVRDRPFAGDEIVRDPGQGVVRFILTAAVRTGAVAARALLQPLRQLGAQGGVNRVAGVQCRLGLLREEDSEASAHRACAADRGSLPPPASYEPDVCSCGSGGAAFQRARHERRLQAQAARGVQVAGHVRRPSSPAAAPTQAVPRRSGRSWYPVCRHAPARTADDTVSRGGQRSAPGWSSSPRSRWTALP